MSIWAKAVAAVSAGGWPGSVAAALSKLFTGDGADGTDPSTDVRFTIALIALCAKMARSDGFVTDDEVAAFERVIRVPAEEDANVRRLFDLAKQDVAGFEEHARRIGRLFVDRPDLKRDVIEALMVIAAADGVLHEREDWFVREAAKAVGVPESDMLYVRSLFVADLQNPYAVIGLTPGATNAEIRARHRKLVIENHPDKLIGHGVPAEFVAVAERKLAAINAAFDKIALERGL
ncbi:MAG: TerB family tellurite resistance protein [Hyphomicrobiaceae bacterium]